MDMHIEELKAVIGELIGIIAHVDRGTTHYEGCEASHPRCAAVLRARKVVGGP